VSALLGRVGVEATDLSIEHVAHSRWLTGGIWRASVSGVPMMLKYLSADRDLGETVWHAHWSAGSDAPRHWNYWAREGLAYLEGITDAYRGSGLGPPRTVSVDLTERDCVLLLEFVDGVPAEHWDVSDYGPAAEALGHAQGGYLTDRPLPRHPWLSRGFLRDYSREKPADWSLLYDDRAWDQPLVQRNFPAELRTAATWLHESRDRLYAIADRLPRTLCHLDFWTKNLIRRPDGEVALLDWAFVGDGAVGEDAGNLVPDAVLDHFVPADRLPEFETVVLDGYLSGLRQAGWAGDSRLVRLGMWAAAVKYDWQTPMMLEVASATRQLRYGGTEEIDADHRFRERGRALLHNAHTARRAVALADEMGFGS
jgi:hypothetical protein